MEFAIVTDRKMKEKESKKLTKYFDLAWKQKRIWKMKMTVILILFWAVVTIIRNLGKIVQSAEAVEYTDCITLAR